MLPDDIKYLFTTGELDAANCALASQLAEWRHRQEAGQVCLLDDGGDKEVMVMMKWRRHHKVNELLRLKSIIPIK